MSAAAAPARIACPARVFARQEAESRRLTDALNHASGAQARVAQANQSHAVAGTLLGCADPQPGTFNSRQCREVARLRANAAGRFLRAARLAS